MTAAQPYKILFVCRHNSMRSQIAEVLGNKIGGDNVSVFSAGSEPEPVTEEIRNWAETISPGAALTSTPLVDMEGQNFDLIITLCDKSHAALPELSSDEDHVKWDIHQANEGDEVKQLEIELAERIRLLLLAKHLI